MLRTAIFCGFKNFKQDIGLPQHITIKGTFKRLTRTYPRTYSAFRFGFALSMTITLTLALIPGSSIPGQKPYKSFLTRKYEVIYEGYQISGIYGSCKACLQTPMDTFCSSTACFSTQWNNK